MSQVLRRLSPDVAALAEIAFRESRRRKWLPLDITFESWLISAIYERAELLVQHAILGGAERERFTIFARPYILDGGLTIYFEV